MRRLLRTSFLLAGLPAALIAQSPDPSALRKEVEAQIQGMEAAFARRDMKGVAAYYADNAVVRHPRGVAAVGRKALDSYWVDMKEPKKWTLEVYGVTPAEGTNLVYQTGRSTLVQGTTQERTSVVEFMVVWQRQNDGKLRIILDYYHSPERSR